MLCEWEFWRHSKSYFTLTAGFCSYCSCEAPELGADIELERRGLCQVMTHSPTVLTEVQQFSWNIFSSDCCKHWLISRVLQMFLQTIFDSVLVAFMKKKVGEPTAHHPRISTSLSLLSPHSNSAIQISVSYCCVCVHAKLLQLCLTLCDPMYCSPLGFSVHGILQARILEWVAMPSFRGSSWPTKQTSVSYVSCTGRQVLYTSATWEAHQVNHE